MANAAIAQIIRQPAGDSSWPSQPSRHRLAARSVEDPMLTMEGQSARDVRMDG